MSSDQIKAASPAKPYEPQYGAKSGPWTTNEFVEAVYKSLTAKSRNGVASLKGDRTRIKLAAQRGRSCAALLATDRPGQGGQGDRTSAHGEGGWAFDLTGYWVSVDHPKLAPSHGDAPAEATTWASR